MQIRVKIKIAITKYSYISIRKYAHYYIILGVFQTIVRNGFKRIGYK